MSILDGNAIIIVIEGQQPVVNLAWSHCEDLTTVFSRAAKNYRQVNIYDDRRQVDEHRQVA